AESYRDCEMIPDNFINFQYDPLACAAALDAPVGLEFSQMGLTFTLEDGLLRERIDPSGRSFKVLIGVDATAFTCHWREIVARG
ncbi:MAG: hypothetical protein JW750_05190, partial [Anaerolineaceae bacterium]|nr:hypothetical protein [Anaerolineaceae bacterium]